MLDSATGRCILPGGFTTESVHAERNPRDRRITRVARGALGPDYPNYLANYIEAQVWNHEPLWWTYRSGCTG